MQTKIVTRDSLQKLINEGNHAKKIAIVGRALVHIYKRQTTSEQVDNTTVIRNGIGFNGQDGRSGCLTAKTFMKNGTLTDWQLTRWVKKNGKGHSRIAKYHGQLNDIALENRERENA